jgi:hypothetical protein
MLGIMVKMALGYIIRLTYSHHQIHFFSQEEQVVLVMLRVLVEGVEMVDSVVEEVVVVLVSLEVEAEMVVMV